MSGSAPEDEADHTPMVNPELLGDHRQVSGSDLTLLEAINTGVVPRPELIGWYDWQRWRTAIGRRPTMSEDGYTLPRQIETSLWRATMAELYGAEWTGA